MFINDPLLADIIDKIKFRLIDTKMSGALYDSSDISRTDAYSALDVANTEISGDTPVFDLNLLLTPRMSTIANAYIFNRLVQNMPANLAYLNIGTWCGFSFFSGIIGNSDKKCIGVDNFVGVSDSENSDKIKTIFDFQYAKFRNSNSSFFEMDYQEYFRQTHKEPLGLYFYDGEHTYEHQLNGLRVADPYIVSGGYAIIDDTNMEAVRNATTDFVSKSKGAYKIVLDISTPNNGHPTFWDGLIILRKK